MCPSDPSDPAFGLTDVPPLLDDRTRPDFRAVFGRLARRASRIDVALTHLRLSTLDLSEAELGRIQRVRLLLAEVSAVALDAEAHAVLHRSGMAANLRRAGDPPPSRPHRGAVGPAGRVGARLLDLSRPSGVFRPSLRSGADPPGPGARLGAWGRGRDTDGAALRGDLAQGPRHPTRRRGHPRPGGARGACTRPGRDLPPKDSRKPNWDNEFRAPRRARFR